MTLDRRSFGLGLGLSAALAAGAAHADPLVTQPRGRQGLLTEVPRTPVLDLTSRFPQRIEIASFDWVKGPKSAGVFRVRSKDGAEGVIYSAHTKWTALPGFFSEVVKPYFIGRDARDLEEILIRYARREYEWSGIAMWVAYAHAELAILDMLGRIAGVPVAELLGGVKRRDIAMYVSSTQRGGDPAPVIAAMQARMAETGCTGVKIKIGARMGRNADASPGWTEAIVRETRKALGDKAVIYADANSAYDAPTGIKVAHMLHEHGVALFEEPCPSEDVTMTAQVAKRARVPIAGGENLANMAIWRDAMSGAFDVIQPDPIYGGGMIRCLALAREAARLGLGFNPHFPRTGAECAPLLHICAAAPTLWGLQEYRLQDLPQDIPHSSQYAIKDGIMRLPDAPGFGVDFDPGLWAKAQAL